MTSKKTIYASLIITLLFSCNNVAQKSTSAEKNTTMQPVKVEAENGLEKAYFASGCFWCVEAIYESLIGVEEAISGYAGGHTENPTYQSSNTGLTGHAEAIEVIYNPEKISFSKLIDVYFATQDPSQINGQGPDLGSQYRSIIFYQNEAEKQIIETKKVALSAQLNINLAAEVLPFQKFWKAEDYHQDYKKLNPNNPYIKNVSAARLKKCRIYFPELMKE